jgi:hypothetical protein
VTPGGVYAKWQGAHWVLAALAELGYPPGDKALVPMRDMVCEEWLAEQYQHDIEATTEAAAARVRHRGVPVVAGRHRRCGSQQGNALLAIVRLGLTDGYADRLAERLRHWQWPDGGWNCDKVPSADTSSFMETLLPMRALWAYSKDDAARRAAEVFLTRGLYRRRSDGAVIHPEFLRLHHPLYWHYDILGGLVGLAELGLTGDPRCADALDVLESKRLPDGGWPAENRYYRKVSAEVALHNDYVDWGGVSRRRRNEWVTADALAVLAAAGRLT